ncbi:MAG: iron-containing alcohol dehydrogenase family protein [Acidimicrobiales bacterium]
MTLSSRTIAVAPHPHVAFGSGISRSLPEHLRPLGTRAFLVVDRGVLAAGLHEPIVASLAEAGIEHLVFSDVDPNPTDANVDAGVAALRDFGEAVVVLIGGGSAMDCGKYVALAAANDGGGTDFAFHVGLDDGDQIDFATLAAPKQASVDGYPTLAIPTTSGTASETNGGGLITDTSEGRKLTFSHASVRPSVVLLDPDLTLGLPPVPTATCGMDALTHSIECLTSSGATPYADGLALQAIRTIGEWLPRVMDEPSDLEGRSHLQWASHLAGIAFSSGPLLGLVHALGHPISARLHQAHGQTLATMLPHVMDFNREPCAERYGLVAQALGADRSVDAAIEAVVALSERVGTHRTLGDLGGDEQLVGVLAGDALADLMILTTPRYPDRNEVETLYRSAL